MSRRYTRSTERRANPPGRPPVDHPVPIVSTLLGLKENRKYFYKVPLRLYYKVIMIRDVKDGPRY